MSYEIKGAKEIERMLTKLPLKVSKKAVVKTFRKGARPFVKQLKSNLTGGLKKTVGTKSLRGKEPALKAGIITNKKKYKSGAGSELDAYLVAYWLEYGTLSKRSKEHKFIKARKKKTRNWRGGINPGRTITAAAEATEKEAEEIVLNTLQSNLEKEMDKYLKK